MATLTRVPTSDSASGTWSPASGSIYAVIDDNPPLGSGGDGDSVVHGTTTAGALTLAFTAFNVPAGSTISRVSVYGRARKSATQANSITPWVISNATGGTPTYRHGTVWALTNGVTANFQRDWTADPRTNAAWTVAAVNALAAFGTYSSDANPTITIYQMYIEVAYTEAPVANPQMNLNSKFWG